MGRTGRMDGGDRGTGGRTGYPKTRSKSGRDSRLLSLEMINPTSCSESQSVSYNRPKPTRARGSLLSHVRADLQVDIRCEPITADATGENVGGGVYVSPTNDDHYIKRRWSDLDETLTFRVLVWPTSTRRPLEDLSSVI